MIDFHTHILPGMDDGSEGIEMSLAMLRKMGTEKDTAIATSHFYLEKESPQDYIVRREEAYRRLILQMDSSMPHIILGAEVFFFDEIGHRDDIEKLAIGQTPYILIEMPFSVWTNRTYNSLYNLIAKHGLIPIIAHIERYLERQGTDRINRLMSMDVLIQMNASYLLNRSTKHKALAMLKKQKVHLLGSDCHNVDSRSPNLQEAYRLTEKKLGQEQLMKIDRCGYQVLHGVGNRN